MQKHNGKRSLEAYKIFPYVAWVLIVGFAFFVYNIITELEDTAERLETQTSTLQQQIDTNDVDSDFDAVIDARQNVSDT